MNDVRTHAIMRKDFIYRGHHFVIKVATNFKFNSTDTKLPYLRTMQGGNVGNYGWRHNLQIEHIKDKWKVEREIGDGDPIAESIEAEVRRMEQQAETYIDGKLKEDPVVKAFKKLGFAMETKGIQVRSQGESQ